MRFSKYLGILTCVWYIHIYIHLCVCVRFSKKVQSTVETAPNEAIHCCWKQSLINSVYLLFKYWFSISWWRPAKPRTGTHFHSWLVLEQYVLALTGFRPRKPQGVDFVTIIKFQFRASNYSQKCVCVSMYHICDTMCVHLYSNKILTRKPHTQIYIYIYTYAYMYIYIHIFMHICIYIIYTYMYI